jgi:tetratricopeptide (TPR) repeat protein
MKRLFPAFSIQSAALMVCIFLFCLQSTRAEADSLVIDADRQYRYAQSLYDRGAFTEAIQEFGRFIYFFPNDFRISRANYLLGMAHFKARQYPDAVRVFAALADKGKDTGLKSKAVFMLSRSHARQGMIEQAMLDLHKLIADTTDPNVIDRAHYELGWLHVDQGQWETARRSFGRISREHQPRYQVEDLNDALSRHDQIRTRNPVTAGILSIIPGGGQMYCGRYQDALAAFLINAGLMLSAWEAFDNELYALGGVISFVEFGFYSGNIYGAVSGAHKFNRDHNDAFRNDLYQHRRPPLSIAATASGITLCLSIDF